MSVTPDSVSLRAQPRGGRRRIAPVNAHKRREARTAYLFLAPWFLGLFVITVGPILASLYLSFTDFNMLETAKWIGLDNYAKMFTEDTRFLT
ncbi:ABC transporter permease, partial [Nonomuraea sp. NPDC050680]